MKKLLTLVIITAVLCMLAVSVYAATSEVNYEGYNPGNGIGLLTYLKWERTVEVDGQILAKNTPVIVSDLNAKITVEGKNSKGNLIYLGNYDGTLVEGLNSIEFKVYNVNTDPKIWSPGKKFYDYKIHIQVNVLPEITCTPTETPEITATETITATPEITCTPTATATTTPVATETETLPNTGEKDLNVLIAVGLVLVLTGIIFTVFSIRKKAYNNYINRKR